MAMHGHTHNLFETSLPLLRRSCIARSISLGMAEGVYMKQFRSGVGPNVDDWKVKHVLMNTCKTEV